jgi:hypothetical protein
MNDVDRFDHQAREHGAWLDIMAEMRARGLEPNDAEQNLLVFAIRKWGEELHHLRLADPQYDAKALGEARAEYPGQYERGTYPEGTR